MSAVVHSEEQLPRTAGWQSSVKLPSPTSPWEVPVPPPGQGSGEPLSQASKHLRCITNALEQRGGMELGEKKNRKNPEARKQNTGTKKPGAVVKIDFCLLETVSRKRHSSFMLIHSGFCLPPPANLASSSMVCHWLPV